MSPLRADGRLAYKRKGIRQSGFTLLEVLIACVILGLVAGTVIRATGQSLRREELNAVVIDLYGWLESVQRRASNRFDPVSPGCTVNFNRGSMRPGEVLASTTFACAPAGSELQGSSTGVFRLPNTNGEQPFSVQIFTNTSITFSPRGTNDLRQPLTIEITRAGSAITRCLRIDPLLGFQAIGGSNNQTPTDNQDCPEASFDGTF